jgi:hypothetical protein
MFNCRTVVLSELQDGTIQKAVPNILVAVDRKDSG